MADVICVATVLAKAHEPALLAFCERHRLPLVAFSVHEIDDCLDENPSLARSGFERAIVAMNPLWARIGFERAERPVAAVEKFVKDTLFDCRMCGQCILSSTGMSCPMNCPKNLRNGPCGGVRSNGNCEVYPDMPCVWVKAFEGSLAMKHGARIAEVQPPIDHRLKGTSSWLRVVRQKTGLAAPATKTH